MAMESDRTDIRKKVIDSCKRVVVKAGTRLLTDPKAIPELVTQIKKIRDSGRQVIFVSSGAVGTAMKSLGMKKRPKHLSEVQALAAMGQVKLMSMYEEECLKHGFRVAQLLLTADDLRSRERHLNAENCLEALLAQDVMPIVNENDPVSVDELKFGDNDILASLLGSMTRSDLTIILTTVDGLLRPNPDGSLGERISVVRGITPELLAMAAGTDDSSMSVGGMKSKLRAAENLNIAGECLWVACGKDAGVLSRIFRGEDVGTLFVPESAGQDGVSHKMEAKKRWIATFSKPCGKLIVDEGAVKALLKTGCSLLPSGLIAIDGVFHRGDVVEICSGTGQVIAKGQINFSAEDCRMLAGRQTSDISDILHADAEEEVIHRNNMVILPCRKQA